MNSAAPANEARVPAVGGCAKRSEALFKHLLAAMMTLAPFPSTSLAASFIVNSELDQVDAVPGDGVCATASEACTLRAAIQEANALAGEESIEVPAGNHVLTIPGTDEDAAATGDLDITDGLNVTGAGMDKSVIDAGGLDRVLEIQNVDFRQPVGPSGITILVGDTALVASSLAGLRIVDVSKPAVPDVAGSLQL